MHKTSRRKALEGAHRSMHLGSTHIQQLVALAGGSFHHHLGLTQVLLHGIYLCGSLRKGAGQGSKG